MVKDSSFLVNHHKALFPKCLIRIFGFGSSRLF